MGMTPAFDLNMSARLLKELRTSRILKIGRMTYVHMCLGNVTTLFPVDISRHASRL